MKLTMKRIVGIVCAFALALSLTMGFAQAKADGETKKAYVTIEKLTIGQGFALEPTSVTLNDGDTIETVFKKAVNIAGLDYVADDPNFYLRGIKNTDNGNINIPTAISNMAPIDASWLGKTVYAPTNDVNDGNNDSNLDEKDYSELSGWMFTCNNISVYDTSTEVEDGDVIRAQFTVFGLGSDIGLGWDPETNLSVANRDALIKRVADISEDPDELAKYDTEYTAAKNVLSKYESTQDDVDNALRALNGEVITTVEPTTEEQSTVVPTTTQAQTTKAPETTTAKISVAKASIKSIKNVKKRKAKITVKPVAGATGYVFKYSKYKSFKKATRKETTKTFIKTKKFKKKQTCYAKVQAYKVVNEEKHFGKWSAVKKVKIKK